MLLGLILALPSAVATNLAFLFKHRGAVLAPPILVPHPLRSAVGLFRSGGSWSAGSWRSWPGVCTSVRYRSRRSRVASNWVREEKLEKVLPNAPKITSGEVVLHKTSELVQA